MSDALFSALEVETTTRSRAGYRLQRLEVFNWGTFDSRVWRLDLDGETSLLTGDIGSGKSTLVDAVTTLLLPAHRIAYNKAAGADTRERTLRSYVEGHYKSERPEGLGAARAIGLRDHRSYSVILGVFGNEGYDEQVTVAQVFHQKDRAGQPDRFFVTAAQELSIEADFTDFGRDLTALRRRLRDRGADIANSFPDYGRHYRRLLGIRSEQAMELFHQTVSMKSVGNLNDFVRSHMLEPVDAADKVAAIIGHFEDLTRAHEAVRRARDQLSLLDPLVATADRYDEARGRQDELQRQRDAVDLFFADLQIELLDAEIEAEQQVREQRRREAEELRVTLDDLVRRREALIAERAAAGGDRLGQLERDIETGTAEAAARRARADRFAEQLTAAGLQPIGDRDGFARLADRVGDELARATSEQAASDTEIVDLSTRRKELLDSAGTLRAELESLAGRRNNLPISHLDLRDQLCDVLGIAAADLPFAGELIDVADDHEDWRGAAERVLHGFALSLLVPQDHYGQVADWVNRHRLTARDGRSGRERGLRLVYERVPRRRVGLAQTRAAEPGLVLADVLEVAPGSFEDYLHDQLGRRAGHRCAETIEEFREADRAVTREGQIRVGDRHEKDDRSRIDDPTRWVLGWANERKIDALTRQLSGLQSQLVDLDEQLETASARRAQVGDRRTALAKLEEYRHWSDLDWADSESRVTAAREERERLLSGSSRLAEIDRSLQHNESQRTTAREAFDAHQHEISRLTERIEQSGRARGRQQHFRIGQPEQVRDRARDAYPALRESLGKRLPTQSADCPGTAADVTRTLQSGIERLGRELGAHSTNLMGQMHEVRRRWPEATTEMDTNVEARGDFRAFRDRVATDDLPAFEDEFKRQLNTNTIRELAGFNSWLRRQAEEINDRVATINEALGAIDYTTGRYIRLEAERTAHQEIQQFRNDLRSATDDTLGSDGDQYSEQRFVEVQRIIERFRGRDGHADADKAWTQRVTDVRNWFSFSASERSRDTDEEWEHYRDSDGKSGGQKEKLAYTILAASLAYQFGLAWGVEKSKDFRFAVIDEAFGRGSDGSTRFALDLFAKLGLQLLIVTPLQKVHVIEPYVSAIGFVDNLEGRYSRLHTLSIEEFRDQRGKAR